MAVTASVAALAAVGLSGCSASSAASPLAPTDAPVLRLGYFANITHALPLVGVQDGTYARDLGTTKLETQIFNAGPAEVEALLAGSLDAAYLGPNSAINAFTRSDGQAIRIVSGAASGGAELVALPRYTSAASLKGTTLADPQLGGTQDVSLRYWLSQHGLSAPTTGSGDVTVAPQENAQTLELFRQGRIAGAWLPEPWASRLVVEAGAAQLVDERSLWPSGQFASAELVVTTAFLQSHPQTVTKLLQAEADTLRSIQADPTKAKASAQAALLALTGKQLKTATLDRAWTKFTPTLDPIAASLQAEADHAVVVGTSSRKRLDGIYDLTLLNRLQAAAGAAKFSADGLGKE